MPGDKMEEIKKNIILLGDGAVGKTSLIRRFVLDQFNDNYITTIGTKVTKKEITVSNGSQTYRVVMMIWDVIGQKDYGQTHSLSIQNMDGALLVSDLTRLETLESLQGYWIPKTIVSRGQIPMIFLGNKADLEEKAFGMEEIKKIAKQSQAFNSGVTESFLTSAKTGDNIEVAFEILAKALLDNMDNKTKPEGEDIIEVESLANIVDQVMADFAGLYGGIEPATPIVRHQMELSGLDPRSPTRDSVEKFIARISEIEGRLLKPDEVAERKAKRLQLVKSVNS